MGADWSEESFKAEIVAAAAHLDQWLLSDSETHWHLGTSTDHKSTHNMEDIFHFIREGNAIQVRMWLDDTEHDMNQG